MSVSEAEYVAHLRRSVAAIKALELKVGSLERARTEPIAIVGMACRFPGGVVDPAAFWGLLRDGKDGVRRILPERWPAGAIAGDHPEVRWAGILDGIGEFDAAFFGISPHEATRLDPQQRLLLEVVWEALENAGKRPEGLMSSRTGVFVGLCSLDYQAIVHQSVDPLDAYCGTGNMLSTAAGRISYDARDHGCGGRHAGALAGRPLQDLRR
jgi:acyl transferase domain-containing protein